MKINNTSNKNQMKKNKNKNTLNGEKDVKINK
jgi:hypothetical protein